MKTARKNKSPARPRRGRRWQLQEAKNKLSELIRLAREQGPQTITIHGKDAVVVTAAEAAGRDSRKAPSLLELLEPLRGLELQIPERSTEPARVVFSEGTDE